MSKPEIVNASPELLHLAATAGALDAELEGLPPGAEADNLSASAEASEPERVPVAKELAAVVKMARAFPLVAEYFPASVAVLSDAAIDTWAEECGPLCDEMGWSVTGLMGEHENKVRAAIATFGLGFGVWKASRLDLERLRGEQHAAGDDEPVKTEEANTPNTPSGGVSIGGVPVGAV